MEICGAGLRFGKRPSNPNQRSPARAQDTSVGPSRAKATHPPRTTERRPGHGAAIPRHRAARARAQHRSRRREHQRGSLDRGEGRLTVPRGGPGRTAGPPEGRSGKGRPRFSMSDRRITDALTRYFAPGRPTKEARHPGTEPLDHTVPQTDPTARAAFAGAPRSRSPGP